MRSRIAMRIAVGIAAAASVVALALPGAVAAASVQVVVGREIAGHGTLLVAASNQMTVYTFDKDVAGSGVSNCTGQCLTNWPALTITAGDTPTGGAGVTGALATIVRTDNGATQVTYDGKPLYFFSHDTAPGDANGIYTNWRAIVLAAPAATPTPAPTAAPTAAPTTAPVSAAATVSIGEKNDKYFFGPSTVFVNVGTTVAWKNGTDAPHTVTSNTGSVLASSTVAAGNTFTHTFTSAGTFAYHCTIHPYMMGTVVVLAAGVTPPPTDKTAPAGSSSTTGELALVVLVALFASAGLIARRLDARRAQID